MKKMAALILALVMCVALSACGGQSKEAEFIGKISGEWINAADGDTYTLNEDGTGKHDNVACQYTADAKENVVTISEGVGSSTSTRMLLQDLNGRTVMIPEAKNYYYVRPDDYDAVSKELQEETTEVLISQEFWTSLSAVNYISFTKDGGGWFLIPGTTLGLTWEFVDNNTIRVHIEYDGNGSSITLDVVNENGVKQLVNSQTGAVAYVPKQ